MQSNVTSMWIQDHRPRLDLQKCKQQTLIKPQLGNNDESVKKDIVKVFGKEILDKDGAIDRTKLGDLIFSNTQKRRQLNKIMHRRIFWKMLSEFWELRMRQKHQLIIIDAPLLYETKFLEYFCYPIIVVGITEDDILVKRMMTRDKINEEQAKNKIKAQMPIEDKIEKGDIVINNNGNVNHLVNELKNTVIPGIYEKLNFKD